jgi:hypothetical protein
MTPDQLRHEETRAWRFDPTGRADELPELLARAMERKYGAR